MDKTTEDSTVDGGAGQSPTGTPAPVLPDYEGARKRGIIVLPPRRDEDAVPAMPDYLCQDCGLPTATSKGKETHEEAGVPCPDPPAGPERERATEKRRDRKGKWK